MGGWAVFLILEQKVGCVHPLLKDRGKLLPMAEKLIPSVIDWLTYVCSCSSVICLLTVYIFILIYIQLHFSTVSGSVYLVKEIQSAEFECAIIGL
jgi:hypothetical protein